MKKLTAIILFSWASFPTSAQGTTVLENDNLRAEFNKQGALIRLTNRATGWEIVKRKSLGQSFELLMPWPENDIRFNVIEGVKQKAPTIERKANEIIFTWKGMRSPSMKSEADVTFKGSVSLTPEGLEYKGVVINKSPYPIEYVSWPCLGEVSIPDKSRPLYHATRQDTRELFPHFFSQHGYWGVDYPTSTYPLTEGAFVLVNNADQGFVAYEKNQGQRLLIASFELIPGFELRNTNPYGDEMDGQRVRIQFKVNQVIYNSQGETALEPLVLSLYKGNLFTGIDKIKNRDKLPAAVSPSWFSEPLVWQKINIDKASQLIEHAKESAPLGIDGLQVRGWYSKDKDGVHEISGLAEAIGKCHEMNIRVVLETNWTSIEDHPEEEKYLMLDPFGLPYTASVICPIDDAARNKALQDWGKLQAFYAADGFINNDNNHQNKSYLCFSKKHSHSFGAPVANAALLMDKIMTEKMKSFGKDKIAMGYGFTHQQNVWYNGYQIAVPPSQFYKHRFLSPGAPVFLPVDAKEARKNINDAFLFQFNPAYDFRLKDYPNIASYSKKVRSFMQRHKPQIWRGVIQKPDEASALGDNLSYSVWLDEKKKKVVRVANVSEENECAVTIKTTAPAVFIVASPENPEGQPYRESFTIKPLSIAVFFEQ